MKDLVAALQKAQRIAIVSHRDPDPDTIGSAVALGLGLEQLGKEVSWHCADPVPEAIRFLARSDSYQSTPPAESVDLVVTVDFGDASRAKFELPTAPLLANIDHHASNRGLGTVGLVDASSAATGELVGRVIDALGVQWTSEMATAALVAIMTDTGSFQFPNTDERALLRAAQLRGAGADLQQITYSVFRNKRFEALQLLGVALSRLQREQHGLLIWTRIDAADLANAGARDEDISGIVEQVARSAGARLSLFFSASPGAVRISARTSDSAPSVDAAALMGRFGGGGHVRAAGALVVGEFGSVRDRVLAAGREALAGAATG